MLSGKISIIIVNWNGKEDTLECLASISSIKYADYEVVLVDNGSHDDSVRAIKNNFPRAIVIETKENLGFAGANNIGIAKAIERDSAYVFLLNNDTTVEPDILQTLYDTSQSLKDKALIGCKILYYSYSDLIWFAGGRWDNINLRFEHVRIGKMDNKKSSYTVGTDYVCGCALFSSVKLIQDVGIFDERFFLTFEDTDLCYRARKKGYQLCVVQNAKVFHKVSTSFGGENSDLFNYYMTRNFLLWAEKHLDKKKLFAVYKRELLELLKYLLPPRSINQKYRNKNDITGNKFIQCYLQTVKDKYMNSLNKARRRGIVDYCLRRFGCKQ